MKITCAGVNLDLNTQEERVLSTIDFVRTIIRSYRTEGNKKTSKIKNNLTSEPIRLIEDMFDVIYFTKGSYNGIYADLSFGLAGFLIEAIRRKFIFNTPHIDDPIERIKSIVQNEIFGIELDYNLYSTVVLYFRAYFKVDQVPLHCADALTYNFSTLKKLVTDMKTFVVCCGNPPYQPAIKKVGKGQGSGSKLWHKFVEKNFEVMAGNGVVALLTPNHWRMSNFTGGQPKKARDLIWANNIITYKDVKKDFPEIGNSINIDYWIVSSDKNDPSMIKIPKTLRKIQLLPRDINDTKILDFFKAVESEECFEMTIKPNPAGKKYSHVRGKTGDTHHQSQQANTSSQVRRGIFDWYDKPTPGQNEKKVIISDSANIGAFYDNGVIGCGHHSYGYKVANATEGKKLVDFINNDVIELLYPFCQEASFGLPIHLFFRIPKSWVLK
jgi:Eco57I restriction-modification methylase